jgi:HlyD family secretion protein
MNLPVYSTDDINQNVISFKFGIKTQSKLLYAILLFAIIAGCASLPFIEVQISVNASGVFESQTETVQLSAPISGRVLHVNLRDNLFVHRGDTLLVLDASLSEKKTGIIKDRVQTIADQLHDAKKLLAQKQYIGVNPDLNTGQYRASLQQLQQELNNGKLAKDQAEKTFKRYDELYKNKVLSEAEYEKYSTEYQQATYSYNLILSRYRSQWELDIKGFQKDLNDLNGQQAELNDEDKRYILRAPINGSIQNLSGIQKGAFVSASEKIGNISPTSGLFAFCYIKPEDIGLIHKGQRVNFQIDAFNYNQWGLLAGQVTDISDDILLPSVNNQPVFKLKCVIDKDYLSLKNGYKGYIKKGMSFTARLNVAKRSLYQLLYDKIDDWVNPNMKNKGS